MLGSDRKRKNQTPVKNQKIASNCSNEKTGHRQKSTKGLKHLFISQEEEVSAAMREQKVDEQKIPVTSAERQKQCFSSCTHGRSRKESDKYRDCNKIVRL